MIIPLAMSAGGILGGCAHPKKHFRTDDATLTQADLPINVEKNFQRDHAASTVKQIDKQINDGDVRYIITYYDTDGTRHQAAYDREGDVLSAGQDETPDGTK